MLTRLLKTLFSGKSAPPTPQGNELLPPPSLQQFVGGAYKEVGEEFLCYLVELCALKPHEAVLDIGCGSGRIAVPLARYLDSAGLYQGFDVSGEAIDWCRRNITVRYPNFHFQVADIQNGPYNPKGRYQPSEYRFPYADGVFDVVFLASVFTHLLPADTTHYVNEIVRVLKPGGRVLSTFFLLNEESITLTQARRGTYHFEFSGPGYRSIHADRPEEGVAYPEDFIRGLFASAGLTIQEPIRYGSWCGRQPFLSFQDIILAASHSVD